MAASHQQQSNMTKMLSSQLRTKANEFLNSRKNANNLADILQAFEMETDNYTPMVLTVEIVFLELLRRREMYIEVVPLKPSEHTAENEYREWLNECYENGWQLLLRCMTVGKTSSRLQSIVTAMKLVGAEGKYPIESGLQPGTYYFPIMRLKNIFGVLLDSEISMLPVIMRFQEFTEYKDVVQFGLKVLINMPFKKNASHIYMNNYLELLDKLLSMDVSGGRRVGSKGDEDKLLCSTDENGTFHLNIVKLRRHANRAWGFISQWPLCSDNKTHRRALLLLIERLMPLLSKPQIATDMLMDSLDAGGPISMLALQGVLELVRRHNIDYPDIYDRLYAMLEPEMFATRYKQRLMHLTDVFLSSTHLPEALVAAFAKRLSRLALVASPEDAVSALQLIANLLHRHPGLKRMVCYDAAHTVMSTDPYVSEETSVTAANALQSSLWEVAALRQHWLPSVSMAAVRVLENVDSRDSQPLQLPPTDDGMLFEVELKKRFKSIEMNFIRPQSMALPSGERLTHYWQLTI